MDTAIVVFTRDLRLHDKARSANRARFLAESLATCAPPCASAAPT
jgi:hypothetical protein